MTHPNPADELAELRGEIARLRLREATLRAEILRQPARQLIGRWNRVVIETRLVECFDATLLPVAIRSDPAYLHTRQLQILRSLPLPMMPAARPGWPIQREAALH